MIVDGKKIAADIYVSVANEVAALKTAPVLAAITCAPNFETQKYLALKKRKAQEVGIVLRVIELPEQVTTEEAVACVKQVAAEVDGVVVQLPFPIHIDREVVLAAVPIDKDPDGFSYATVSDACVPPVVGAIKEIASYYHIPLTEKNVLVLGQGRLVGAPAVRFLRQAGAEVVVSNEGDTDQVAKLRAADIVVSGVGQPHFITPDKVKPGVVVFDAGASEDGGVMVGDVHPEVASLAALFTPVPGGIGPITVALLLQNVLKLTKKVQNN